MFHVMLQSYELTYNTRTDKYLQYECKLCFVSHWGHSTKPSDEINHKPRQFMQNGSVGTITLKMCKLQNANTITGTKIA